GTELFARDLHVDALVHVDGQPNPFIAVSDALRIAALKRFPWSPLVVREAESRLLRRAYLEALPPWARSRDATRGVIDDSLLAVRRDAVLYEDAARRSAFLADLMKGGELEPFLLALEGSAERTPVHDRLLLDGWARLSRFEHAAPFADRLAEAYPGDAAVARDAMTLHRSLSALDRSHAAAVERVARRAEPALENPRETLVALGETWQDLERPEPAGAAWRAVVALSPRDPSAILEIATVFWDYGRMQEALDVLADGRARLSRPRMNAFEAGVLREELHDLPSALEEYLAAAYRGELDWSAGRWSGGGEWRARDRLARLVARPRVEAFFVSRIAALAPGVRGDEERLVSLAGLLTLVPEEPCNCDDWIDLPNDAVGREERVERRVAARPKEGPAIGRLGRALFAKTLEMIPSATRPELLAALRERSRFLTDKRWAADPRADVTLEAALLAREAVLAPDAEARIEKEIALAGTLAAHERLEDARRLWAELPARIDKLPEGAAKIRALVASARFAERSGGDPAASWAALSARYPRSLGVLEDHLEFLFRTKRTKEGLDLLEASARLAASGHRENLTERLAKESLDRGDLPRGRRALAALLALKPPDERRVTAAGLLARVSLKEGGFDALALGRAEAPKLKQDLRAELWAALAGAARDEGQPALAVDLLIESLNVRLDRGRLDEASRLAVSAGTDAHLLRFFEAQRKRSPRDVRWAVAVREIHTFAGNLDRAIEASKEAALVAPGRESLQEETVQLFLRAGRPREGAEFLETWAKTRKGDEKVASWRASLFVNAGDVPRALTEENSSLEAWKASAVRTEDEVSQRTARISRRFLSLDQADAAWRVAVPGGDLAAARTVPLSHAERVEIALRADRTGGHRLVDLVRAFEGDEAFRAQAPPVVRRLGKPEAKRGLQSALLARLFPHGARDEAALDVVWDFARDSGLHRFPEAVARRLVASPARPWGENPPVAFVRTLDPVVPSAGAQGGRRRWLFSNEDFRREWAQYLVSRDRLLVLERLLAPLVAELDRRVSAPATTREPLAFTRWFPVEAFARIAASSGHDAWRAMVARWLASPAAYARLLDATENRWDVRPLVELVDEKTRSEFLARTAPRPTRPPSAPADPLLAKRDAAAARASSALAALVSGEAGALDSKDVVRLRGPRSVGEILGDDPRFQWALFAPRPVDTGDDAVAGTGVDRLRFPGRLWGLRPGEAWYVLEALARLRERDPLGPLVPLEVPARGRETERTLLAVRAAETLSEMPLALALDEEYFADLADLNRLARRLHLLVAAGRRERADALLVSEIRSRQARARRE
ncbi:MAG TPA: hypothetical protein VKF32_14930, partial [Thermoanaerobaculia bacterium]|nr:hypothetical protein [Thermoanaerobaculia bacterium]